MRILAKEGIVDSEGNAAELHAGELNERRLVTHIMLIQPLFPC